MIICICRKINDRGVQNAIQAGARSPEAVQAFHGCQFNCGKCRCTLGEMIANSVDGETEAADLIAAE